MGMYGKANILGNIERKNTLLVIIKYFLNRIFFKRNYLAKVYRLTSK